MIIASIDLMGGKAVQLRQGKEHVLTSEINPVELARTFHRTGDIAVIDLDAALGSGNNVDLIRRLCDFGHVRVGGGIRNRERGELLLRSGAEKIIIGTAADPELLQYFPPDRVMVALDHVDGEVVDSGWTRGTGENFLERARRLAPYCSGYLCTFVKDEGGMGGMNLELLEQVSQELPHPVTVAGGVASTEEAIRISRKGLDVQVGMALYSGKLDLINATVQSLDFDKTPMMPTIVQDMGGQVLMLAYSTPESLEKALREGKRIYYSRSRQALWEKGLTSGHTQRLISCRTDCDRDALLFTVEQTHTACHTESYSCFGSHHPKPMFRLSQLFNILRHRKQEMPEQSFSAKMFQNREKLLRKIMEEAFEVTLATNTPGNRDELIWEIADTIYFLSLLAVDEDIDWQAIEQELGGRHR